jgi:hypothetical protein
LSWTALIVGLGMLGYCALLLFRMAITMERFGGPAQLFSPSFFEANPRLAPCRFSDSSSLWQGCSA